MSVHSYNGTVIDNQSQAPVSGAWVEALACGGDEREVVAAARTGSRGEFTLAVTDDQLTKLFGGAVPKVFFRVRLGSNLLASTSRTAPWDPRSAGSGVIAVDIATVATSDPSMYSVHGTVAHVDAGPLENMQVAVYRQRLTFAGVTEDQLAVTTSSSDGHYRIEYEAPTGRETDRDIIVKAIDESSNVLASVTLKEAPPRAVVDLVAGGEAGKNYPGPIRFADTLTRVTSHLGLDPGPALKDLNADQVDFIARQTRTPKAGVQSLVDAAKLADQSGIITTETFYALLRTGLPATMDELFLHKTPDLVAAVERAVASRLVSPAVMADPVALNNQLRDAGVAVLRTPVAGSLRLGTLVDNAATATMISPTEATEFLRLALSHQGSIASFWEAVDESGAFTADSRKGLRFAVEAGAISGAFLPVVQILHARVADPGNPLTADPVGLAEYDVTAWRALIDSVPSGPRYPDDTPPGTDTQRRDAYAKQLARNVERRFRTPFISARIRQSQPTSHLATFFADNATFDFFTARVDTYLAEHPTALANIPAPNRDVAVEDLKAIERTARITDNWDETKLLLDSDYKSSSAIEDAGREAFVANIVGPTFSAERAEQVYDNACWTVESATAIIAAYAPATNVVGTASTPDLVKISTQPVHPKLADWTKLFGAPHACSCEHCRSVYGPAAYLADVLQLLKKVPASPSGNARDEIFDRRPDLPILALSCSNAETPLPYVDLVNEILEVKTAVSTWPTTPIRVDTSHTADELLAEPELIYPNEHLAAYRTLRDAVYPFSLPFHLYQEEARIYLEHLGVRRADLLTALAPLGGSANARDLALERLGTSKNQYDIITGPPVSPPGPAAQAYWGITSNYPAALASAKTFLEKSGLSFEELQELLSTSYCKTNNIGFAGNPPPCDLEELTLTNLGGPSDTHHRFLHRFLRLRNVLGWSISDTDKAITALGQPDTTTLSKLGGIRELQRAYDKDPAEFLAWYANVDRNGDWKPSLFERVFLDKRVAAPTDATFKTVFDDGSPTAEIQSVRAGLAAALRVSAADLALLTDPTAADLALRLSPIAPPTEIVSIENLSRLYRVVSFARAARLSLSELMLVRELSGENVLTGDSGTPATPDGTLAFLDTVERTKALPMPLEEVHYLLRHVAPESSSLLLDAEEDLKLWREELEALVKAAAEEATQLVDTNGSVLHPLAENLVKAGLLTADDHLYLKMLVNSPASMGTAPVPTADAFITNTLAPFLAGAADPVAHAKTFLKITPLPIPAIPAEEVPARYTYLA
ncbi:MAG: hypothetical protein HOW73_37650, partial [Polyangiaceae bacterium]|nr:hypothetical protein [Polyangiaceae bacterium]